MTYDNVSNATSKVQQVILISDESFSMQEENFGSCFWETGTSETSSAIPCLALVTFLGLDDEEASKGSSASGSSKSGISSSFSLISSNRCSGFKLACDFVFNRCVGAGAEVSGALISLLSGTCFRGTIFSLF